MRAGDKDGDPHQPRFTAHSVRGLVDVASPLGARWVSNDACDDPFARVVNAAQADLFRNSTLLRPRRPGSRESPEAVGSALVGVGRSPSPVWHAQAIGCLLELGYLPTAESVDKHLKLLDWRLRPPCCRDPATVKNQRDPWLLRTRHVAFVLACLAELPNLKLEDDDFPYLTSTYAKATVKHQEIVDLALSYLLGFDDEVTWTGIDRETLVWFEYWESLQPNVLNTVYAVLGLSRAMRHGWLDPIGWRAAAHELAQRALEGVFERVVVTVGEDGPAVRLRPPLGAAWPEPWAQEDLPDGVVALLCLALLEYAGLHQEMNASTGWPTGYGKAMKAKAQRLAQTLVFRARARGGRSRREPRWPYAADAFVSPMGGGVWSEGEWFLPSYSLGLRAVLEAGVVDIHHAVVKEAIDTIGRWQTTPRRPAGPEYSWIDPTRSRRVHDRAQSARGASWHTAVDLREMFDDEEARHGPTPSGIHAAVMAYASLRRGATRIDPRDLLSSEARPGSERIPIFDQVRIERLRGSHTLTLVAGSTNHTRYEEQARVSGEVCLLLEGIAAAGPNALAKDVVPHIAQRARLVDPKRVRYAKSPAAVIDAAERLNRRFVTTLVNVVGDGTTARLSLGPSLSSN